MKALEMLEHYWQALKRLLSYMRYCAEADMQTLVCRDFWLWSVYVSIGAGLLIAFMIVRIVFREQLEYYRNRKRLAARLVVADEGTMNEAKWRGDDAGDMDLTQEELAARMREAMKARAALQGDAGEPAVTTAEHTAPRT